MSKAQLPAAGMQGTHTLEVRWIAAGPLQAAVADWFARFPAGTESREDAYLLCPRLPALSVKVRGSGLLEAKMYQGSPGLLDVPGRARGRLECWQKWSSPCACADLGSGRLPGWTVVQKSRRAGWFPAAGEPGPEPFRGPDQEPGCAVELTEIHADGQPWWSLGFEATGPPGPARSCLEATAGLVFAQGLPHGAALGLASSQNYAWWLRHRPAASACPRITAPAAQPPGQTARSGAGF